MKLPQIQIHTTDIKLDMNITDPIQRIYQPKATQHIEQSDAIVDIETTPGKLFIDSSQARRDIGLLSPKESVMEYAKKGRKAVLKGIAKTVREGNQVMYNAGKGQGSIVAQIAKQNHAPKPMKLNVKFVPSFGSVKIDYIPAKVDINVTPQKPRIDVQVNKPIHEYIPGDITHEVIQYPSVEIDVKE